MSGGCRHGDPEHPSCECANADRWHDAEVAFGERVRVLRVERGLSQRQLAQRLVGAGWGGMTQVMMSKVEQAQRPTRVSELALLGDVLGVSVGALLGDGERGRTVDAAAYEAARERVAEARRALRTSAREVAEAEAALEMTLRNSEGTS